MILWLFWSKAILFFFNNLNNAAYLAVFQPYFDAAGMIGCACEQIFYYSASTFTGFLIWFQDDTNGKAGIYVCACLAIHAAKLINLKIVVQLNARNFNHFQYDKIIMA